MTTPRSLWKGRALALLGIVLCAFSLRSAVASLSPVVEYIAADFALSPTVLGLIGTAPPVCFAIFGLLTPIFERRFGIERLAVIALGLITVGLVWRGLAGDAASLLVATAVIFAGVGMGNILLPPLVKKYFADRIGLMMTLYTTAMAFSTFVPPLLAVPVADTAGWRFSLVLWGAFALAGMLPWLIMLMRKAEPANKEVGAQPSVAQTPDFGAGVVATGPIPTAPTTRATFARLVRIPLVWALAATFGTSSLIAYVSFAWLPSVLIDLGGVSATSAGFLLSLFAFIGLPASLLVPVLVVRFQATRPLFLTAVLASAAGVVGLIVAPLPSLLWLWVLLFGMAGILFPLSLVLISIRSRTSESAVLLSSLVQSIGYILAAIFPVSFGVLHTHTGGWLVPLLVILVVLLAAIPTGLISGRRVTVEDEWEARHGAW